MEDKKIFTRQDRLNNVCTHREFFSQFVNNDIKHIVMYGIGKKAIKNSTDEHMNDIPLKKWDNLNDSMRYAVNSSPWKKATDPDNKHPNGILWAQSDGVCIAKEAARQIKEAM